MSVFLSVCLSLSVCVSVSVCLCVPAGSHSLDGNVTVHVLDINQPSLPLFDSVLVSVSVFIALSTVFCSINSPDNSPLSHSVLRSYFCFIGPFSYIFLYDSLPQP